MGWAIIGLVTALARQTWLETLEGERQLKALRNGGGLVVRLKPLDVLHSHKKSLAHGKQAETFERDSLE